MTEFEKIQNALLDLGWTMERGNGDHIKFTKENSPRRIIVSMSVGMEARALKNTYAEIRRIEPRFPLGRQAHMLPSEDGGADDYSIPADVPEWMYPDKPVRWTAPENRDWSKLMEEHSVMNRKYVVTDYQKTDDGTMAVIRDVHDPGTEPFAVFINELDMWAVCKCSQCHKEFPKNWLVTNDDGQLYCEDCIELLNLEKELEMETTPVEVKKEKRPVDNLAEQFPELKPIVEMLDSINAEIKTMPPEVFEERIAAVAAAVVDLPAKTKKTLIKEYSFAAAYLVPTVVQPSVPEEKVETITPAKAWNRAKDMFMVFAEERFRTDPEYMKLDEKGKIDYIQDKRAKINRCTFESSPLRNKKQKRKVVGTIATISVKDPDMAVLIYQFYDFITFELKYAFPDNPVFLLIHCPKAGIRQYTVDCDMDYEDNFNLLRENLPKSELTFLSRAGYNLMLPDYTTTQYVIVTDCIDAGICKKDEWGGNVVMTYGIKETDPDLFEHTKPIFNLTLKADTVEKPLIDALLEKWKTDFPTDAPVMVYVSRDKGKTVDVLDMTGNYKFPPGIFEEDAGPDENGEDPTLILKINSEWNNDKLGYAFQTFRGDLSENEIVTRITEALLQLATDKPEKEQNIFEQAVWELFYSMDEMYPDEDDEFDLPEPPEGVRIASVRPFAGSDEEILRTEGKVPENNPKNNDTMPNTDFLDAANPTSPDQALAPVSTRNLLKELKRRGVEFENLTITVKKSIDMNEI